MMEYLIADCSPHADRRTIIRSFVEGCTNRISERLIELAERSKTTQSSNGRELVVVKDAAIKALMKQLNIHLRKCDIYSSANVNESARAAGRAAGERATVGRPVSGTAGVPRIGK